MCTLQDEPILIDSQKDPPITYKVRSVHRRRGNANKSIWTIKIPEEVECFRQTYTSLWLEETKGWGLKLSATSQLEEVGVSDQGQILKIAKFRDDEADGVWHGYPANYCYKPQDKPSKKILLKWLEAGLIDKTQKSRISQGKLCNL